jgi:4-hydroxy-4-methyl-2-oxoglutarate aldolase
VTPVHPHIGELTGPKSAIHLEGFDRVPVGVVAAAQGLSAATLHEAAGKVGAMPGAIKPVHPEFRLCGPATTVHGPGGDNLWLHYAIYAAQPGDILVVNCSGRPDHGYWGEVMSTAAKARGLGGLVIEGCVRDFTLLGEVGFPVFARGLNIRGTAKDREAGGWINSVTQFGDVSVSPGDLVVGDADGVVVVSRTVAAEVVAAARQRDLDELEICRRLEAGETTLEIYDLA